MFRILCLLGLTALADAMTYRLTVFAPGTIIDGADIDASANGFYLGLSGPSTYCPIGKGCPAVRGTMVYEGMMAMAVRIHLVLSPPSTIFSLLKNRILMSDSTGRSAWWSSYLRRAKWSSQVHPSSLYIYANGLAHRWLVQ